MVVFRVHFDGVDGSVGGDLGRLDGHRSAAGADVPDHAGRAQVHLGQGHRADLGRRQQPALRLGLEKQLVGVAEQATPDHLAGPVGHLGLADQNHHVQRAELLLGNLGQLAAGHPLVRRPQVLTHIGREIVDLAIQEEACHLRRRVGLAGEQANLLRPPDLLENRFRPVRGQVGQERFFPAFLDPGEGQLHGAYVGHDLEAVFAQLVPQVAGDPIEERVPDGQHHDSPARGGLDPLDRFGQIGADIQALGRQPGHQGQRMVLANEQLGPFDELPRPVG